MASRDKIVVAFDVVEVDSDETPVIPRASVFDARGPGVRPNRVRTFWPYEHEPVEKLVKHVYQLSSDQQVEIGHTRLVLITEDIVRPEECKPLGIVFFQHMIYGRGVIMAGCPCPKDHRKTLHGFFDTVQEGKHAMEWVIEHQAWWRMRHHDRNVPARLEGEGEDQESEEITWSSPIQ